MAQDSTNPFVLPGFGQQGESAHNSLFAGLDMMRQAWQNMATAGSIDKAAMPAMSVEDLDQRIRELQTVQNWLQLNVTMLASTIQGLEIQRSTLATLQSFADSAMAGTAKTTDTQADTSAGQAYVQAATDWWTMVQQQFEQLAAASTVAQEPDSKPASKPKPKPKPAAKAGRRGETTTARAKAAKSAGKTKA